MISILLKHRSTCTLSSPTVILEDLVELEIKSSLNNEMDHIVVCQITIDVKLSSRIPCKFEKGEPSFISPKRNFKQGILTKKGTFIFG